MGASIIKLLAGAAAVVMLETCRPVDAGETLATPSAPFDRPFNGVSHSNAPSTQTSLGTTTGSREPTAVGGPRQGKPVDSYERHNQLRFNRSRLYVSLGAVVAAALLVGVGWLRRPSLGQPMDAVAEEIETPEKAGGQGLGQHLLTGAVLAAAAYFVLVVSQNILDYGWHSTGTPVEARVKAPELLSPSQRMASDTAPFSVVIGLTALVLMLARRLLNSKRAARVGRPDLEKTMAGLYPRGVWDLTAEVKDTFVKQVCNYCGVQLEPYLTEAVNTTNAEKRAFMFARLVTLLQRAKIQQMTDALVNTIDGAVTEKVQNGASITFLRGELRRWDGEFRQIWRDCVEASALAQRAYKKLAQGDYEVVERYLLAERAALKAQLDVNVLVMRTAAEIVTRYRSQVPRTRRNPADVSWEEWSAEKRDILTEAVVDAHAKDELALDAASEVRAQIVLAGMPFATPHQ